MRKPIPTLAITILSSLLVVGRARAVSDRDVAKSAALRAVFCDSMGSPSPGRILRAAVRCQLTLADLVPAACVSTVSNTGTVTITFNDCTSSFEASRHVTGTVVAAVSSDATGVHVSTTGTGVQIDDVTVDLSAAITAFDAGGTRTWIASNVSAGTNRLGHDVGDQSDYTVVSDSRCESVDGSWQQLREGTRTSSTQISRVTKCASSCPQSGGVIVHTNPAGVVTTFSYDGSDVLEFTTSNGGSGSASLSCAPN
jgi:YD repeat-containing protein